MTRADITANLEDFANAGMGGVLARQLLDLGRRGRILFTSRRFRRGLRLGDDDGSALRIEIGVCDPREPAHL